MAVEAAAEADVSADASAKDLQASVSFELRRRRWASCAAWIAILASSAETQNSSTGCRSNGKRHCESIANTRKHRHSQTHSHTHTYARARAHTHTHTFALAQTQPEALSVGAGERWTQTEGSEGSLIRDLALSAVHKSTSWASSRPSRWKASSAPQVGQLVGNS